METTNRKTGEKISPEILNTKNVEELLNNMPVSNAIIYSSISRTHVTATARRVSLRTNRKFIVWVPNGSEYVNVARLE